MRSLWERVLARRVAAFRACTRTDFSQLPSPPGTIHFTGGAPPVECLPVEPLSEALAQTWRREPTALWYGETEGYEGLRAAIAARMQRRGAAVDPDQVLITQGAQQAIDLVARLLLEPGDRVVVEGPTYFGALQVFEPYAVEIEAVPLDEGGVLLDRLEEAFRREPRPKAFYTVPTFQNPAGVTMSAERRQAVVELAARYGVAIVEDDPYGELWYEVPPPPPLRAYWDEVLFLGTFSKTLAPGLRVGWLVAPPRLMKPLIDAKEAADIQSDRMLQRALAAVVSSPWYERHLEAARAEYAERCRLLADALAHELGGLASWSLPGGGFFLWITLVDGVDTASLLPRCAEHGVTYVPGAEFYPDHRASPSLRLGFTTLSRQELLSGAERLGRALRAVLAGTTTG
ncbi:MAG: PLP-dependent aminotransferase family protein [Thermomicrobium sp.]|nr:PLP-dependent aminotransferase family protein [Thermomicrobium sp.]